MHIVTGLLLILLSSMCFAQERYYAFQQNPLQQGRTIWLANCEGCHGWGVGDAPIPMNPEEWRNRLLQSKETLYSHAINSFFGPDDSMTPPRGCNDALSDNQVKSAVAYITAIAKYQIDQSQQKAASEY